jgi:hypothetical protein
VDGFPVDKEIDVAVDFVAPTRPGRYISYWRLASPSGQKFGQRVWVHIQVVTPLLSKNMVAYFVKKCFTLFDNFPYVS